MRLFRRCRGPRRRTAMHELSRPLAPAILFVIITSRTTRDRALSTFSSWCATAISNGCWCQFVSDQPFGGGASNPLPSHNGKPMQWSVVRKVPQPAPGHCCRGKKTGFFCSEHRQKTLRAQYRYLPALAAARRGSIFATGRAKWVVLLDDDSYVFVKRLRRLLSRYDPEKRWLLGEFRHDRAYACGGAGAVLSRSALLSLDLDNCIARSSKRCQQSDWQLGDCVRRLVDGKGGGGGGGGDDGRITLETRHGCNTCAVPARNCSSEACDEPPPAGCHFMQDARPHVGWLRDTANCSRVRGPSIVHGTGVAQALQRGNRGGGGRRLCPRA